MNVQPLEHREGSDLYAGEISRAATATGSFRVIFCHDGFQWIIQRLTRSIGGPRSMAWRAVSYLTTREVLERLWAARTGTLPPPAILALPPRIVKRQQASR